MSDKNQDPSQRQDQANNPGQNQGGQKQKQSPDQANNPDWNKDGGSDQAGQQKEMPRNPGSGSEQSDRE